MNVKQTLGNNVVVKLDPANDIIKTASGFELRIDTTYEPEKHIVRVGTVIEAPTRLIYHHNRPGYPWKTKPELKAGDRVVMYFLAIQNCLSPERKLYTKEGNDIYIFIKYHNIYAAIEEGNVRPINGYVLIEPVEDPEWTRMVEDAKKNDIQLVDLRKPSNVNVTYGKIAYMGTPNEEYADEYKSDRFHDEKVGDTVILKRIRDIPVEYEYHAKIDNGRKLYRVHRHDILAVV
jgi:hypothetical protein